MTNSTTKKGPQCVAMHYTKEEVLVNPLRRVLPTRTFNKGAMPGVKGSVGEDKWDHKDLEVTDFSGTGGGGSYDELNTKIYTFNAIAKYTKQSSGGPIGLRVNCVCAKIVMNPWEAHGSA